MFVVGLPKLSVIDFQKAARLEPSALCVVSSKGEELLAQGLLIASAPADSVGAL